MKVAAHKRRLVIISLAFAGLAMLPSYVWAYKLTSSSASPTINIGGSFLVNKGAYDFRLPYSETILFQTGRPKRGDIVVFRHPTLPIMGPKRVIGLPGETIEFRENRVINDGHELPLKALALAEIDKVDAVNRLGSHVFMEDGHWVAFTPDSGKDRNIPPVPIGAHEYFLVGDNRDNSADSRIWGPLSERQILGKVVYIIRRQ